MRTIYKYPIHLGMNKIELPKGAKPFSAKMDGGGHPCVWAVVNTEVKETEFKYIYVAGTGFDLDSLSTYDCRPH